MVRSERKTSRVRYKPYIPVPKTHPSDGLDVHGVGVTVGDEVVSNRRQRIFNDAVDTKHGLVKFATSFQIGRGEKGQRILLHIGNGTERAFERRLDRVR
eukprot:1148128-Prorocentrum_minimum.AAC.1